MKHPHAVCSYFIPPSSSRRARRASFLRSPFSEPRGMDRLRASTCSATVGKIGPSSGGERGVTILQPALDGFLRHQVRI